MKLVFTVKWAITTSPYSIYGSSSKPGALLRLMTAYFPDPNVTPDHSWSPQDFYQSVHHTDPDDESTKALETPELESVLYPFQKRTVQWLLQHEGVEWSKDDGQVHKIQPENHKELPTSFISTTDTSGKQCFISHLFGIVTRDVEPFRVVENGLRGGILSEEMGLGKTVEIISLVTLHKRLLESKPVLDPYTEEEVRPTAATLIIAPPSILQQWISELNKHAPGLRIYQYGGIIKVREPSEVAKLVDDLANSDVVVTTYSVIAGEINYTKLNPEKSLRRQSKYPRPKSPLLQLSWWRVCMDEAQMIESGVSNAAMVARLIPRVNAWCITGTPVRKDVNDLLGLLIFLRYAPYAITKHTWLSLIQSHRVEFQKLFQKIALRHSKQSVKDELRLPAQRRYVITMPFTPIEEQHYQELFSQMCEDIGVDADGSPLYDDWDPTSSRIVEKMRSWLVRLRQTALHPEVGGRNRRALGYKDGPLRTVDQVLEAMIEQTDVNIRADQRSLLLKQLKRGQFFENSPQVKRALAIWEEVCIEAHNIVEECREQLRLEILAERNASSARQSRSISMQDTESSEPEDEADPSSRVGVFRNRLRGALEIEHTAKFFRANAFFQIKSNEEMTKADTPEFQELEKLETEGYEEAKRLRQEILREIFRKASKLMKTIAKRAATQEFVQIPEFESTPPVGGIESRRIMERLDELGTALDAQANQLDEWREKTIQFLLKALVDEDEGVEITGDEYEESAKTQDEVVVYVQALRTVIADRYDILTGQENKLVQHEAETSLELARDGDGAFPEKTLELLNARLQLKPKREMGSVRGIVSELRGLASSLRIDATNGNRRAENELAIVENQLKLTQKLLTEQTKANLALEKEVELFKNVMNTRLEYYRQLQEVSDMVAPYEGSRSDVVYNKLLEEEARLARKIAISKSKRRYLLHLKMEDTDESEQRLCVICRETIEVGALTVCGHQFCKDCIGQWWRSHHNCPVCKRKLIQADLHEITYKPQELTLHSEELHEQNQERTSPTSATSKTAIYSELSKNKLAEIKNIELDGPSFTTKIDTLARHLIWLRESDPGSKSIIFSQFKDFLDVLGRAFQTFRINYTSIDKPRGIEMFKQDPAIECFLLHARAHSSGLNLVNANHVFLCEPLLNTAIELQAIARVDRIGQKQETNVWLYLIDATVEQSIYQLSVNRRMEHMGKSQYKAKGKSKESTPEDLVASNLEAANSLELQQVSLAGLLTKETKGGEMVKEDDLWACLFGTGDGNASRNVARPIGGTQMRSDPVIRSHLMAEAAEARRDVEEAN
ncbi:putative SNF2 family helicase/ATPase [Xylogone sp. PMI_703]|nr:putative SNF2 family helicase/ATPase [Xylogone sp. PMI_703]